MKFKGKKPICVVHKKVNGKRECICGVKLTYKKGEWIHPEVLPILSGIKTEPHVWNTGTIDYIKYLLEIPTQFFKANIEIGTCVSGDNIYGKPFKITILGIKWDGEYPTVREYELFNAREIENHFLKEE